MESIASVLSRAVDPPHGQNDFRVSTGITALDRYARPLEQGKLWAIVGPPAVGRSTLAAQWASSIALHGQPTVMVSPVGRSVELGAGVLAHVADTRRDQLPLPPRNPGTRETSSESDDEAAARTASAHRRLEESPLMFEEWIREDQRSVSHAASRFTPAVTAVVLDDIDLFGHPDDVLRMARAWCDQVGRLVILTCPSDTALHDGRSVSSTWSRLVDVTVLLEREPIPWGADAVPGLPTPGYDGMRLLTNRWGPLLGFDAWFNPDYGRWQDAPHA